MKRTKFNLKHPSAPKDLSTKDKIQDEYIEYLQIVQKERQNQSEFLF